MLIQDLGCILNEVSNIMGFIGTIYFTRNEITLSIKITDIFRRKNCGF